MKFLPLTDGQRASISSIKIKDGACACASLNTARSRASLTPNSLASSCTQSDQTSCALYYTNEMLRSAERCQ